jgi:nitrogen regulatory protein PII 1
MKMIRCVVRPEREEQVLQSLEGAELIAFTKMDVFGRGRQKGVQVGSTRYEELAKTMFMIVVEDEDVPKAVSAFKEGARTGHPGDGKIFITDVDEAYTIRTGEKTL